MELGQVQGTILLQRFNNLISCLVTQATVIYFQDLQSFVLGEERSKRTTSVHVEEVLAHVNVLYVLLGGCHQNLLDAREELTLVLHTTCSMTLVVLNFYQRLRLRLILWHLKGSPHQW